MAERNSKETPSEEGGKAEKGTGVSEEGEKFSKEEKSEVKRIHYVAAIPECVVCLQPCHHPVELPCSHIFCFLCVKGVAARSHRCALCRAEVPESYFEKPVVVKVEETKTKHEAVEHTEDCTTELTYKWFYEGRNGWWQYEDRASDQIEESFAKGKQAIEIPIAGFGYIIDIENMVQYRKNYPTRRRRIKRDKYQAEKKGVAGLKYGREGQPCQNEVSENNEQKQGLTEGQVTPDKEEFEEQMKSVAEKLDKTL